MADEGWREGAEQIPGILNETPDAVTEEEFWSAQDAAVVPSTGRCQYAARSRLVSRGARVPSGCLSLAVSRLGPATAHTLIIGLQKRVALNSRRKRKVSRISVLASILKSFAQNSPCMISFEMCSRTPTSTRSGVVRWGTSPAITFT